MIAHALLLIALVGLLTSTSYLLLVGVAVLRFRRKCRSVVDSELPAVTLLKPVHGNEPQLQHSLESFFRLDYPRFEIVFGARSNEDAAFTTIRELMRKYPQVAVKLVSSGEPPWANAKCWSLVNMVREASYDHLVISDSDVEVSPHYLREVIPPLLEPGVGCVTTMYRGKPTNGLWTRLEALGMSVEMTSGVLVAEMLEGMKFALGPTMAVRRDVLQQIGGFANFGDYCSDDFLLGQKIAAAGYKVVLSPHVIDHVVLHESLRQSALHQVRWMKSTRFSRPKGHLGMALTFAMPYGLLALLAGSAASRPLLSTIVFVASYLNRAVLSVVAGLGAVRDRRSLYYCWLYPLRDLMAFAVWLASYFSDEIRWRGESYRLGVGGKMARIT